MISDIVKYIPKGHDNAISRQKLCSIFGCSDRIMRDALNIAKKQYPIINVQDGKGYFLPTEKDSELVEKYMKQEKNRAKDIFSNLRPVREFARKMDNGR